MDTHVVLSNPRSGMALVFGPQMAEKLQRISSAPQLDENYLQLVSSRKVEEGAVVHLRVATFEQVSEMPHAPYAKLTMAMEKAAGKIYRAHWRQVPTRIPLTVVPKCGTVRCETSVEGSTLIVHIPAFSTLPREVSRTSPRSKLPTAPPPPPKQDVPTVSVLVDLPGGAREFRLTVVDAYEIALVLADKAGRLAAGGGK